MIRFDGNSLTATMQEVLDRLDVDRESTRHVVASLVQTSLRGVDSHGINLFPHYCRAVAAGRINRSPKITVNRTSRGTATVDADHGFGHHTGSVAMETAIALAGDAGVGAVSVHDSTHFGAAAYFGLQAPERECLGFAYTNADALVKVHDGREPFFGTNPICFTAPLETEPPFCLDMATSLASWNKVKNHRREGTALPPDWAFDANGDRVTDPHAARSLNPAGGYKGYGLGMMVDILCAGLSGGLTSKDIMPMYSPPLDDTKRCISHFFMAIHIPAFTDPVRFRRNLQGIVDRIRRIAPIDPDLAVLVAGDPEKKEFAARSREGIPVDAPVFEEFLNLSNDFSKAVMSP
jgi:ureidoglycolate dehydrogenase (NAD+)